MGPIQAVNLYPNLLGASCAGSRCCLWMLVFVRGQHLIIFSPSGMEVPGQCHPLTPKGQCYSDTWVRDFPEQEGKNVTLFARTENLLYLTTVLKFSWLASRKSCCSNLCWMVSEFVWTHHKCRLSLAQNRQIGFQGLCL